MNNKRKMEKKKRSATYDQNILVNDKDRWYLIWLNRANFFEEKAAFKLKSTYKKESGNSEIMFFLHGKIQH
jgi:hypothetical protein